jgi:hypothetical protein
MEHKDLELKHISIIEEKKYFISTIKMQVRHSWLNQQNNLFVYETMVFKTEDEKVIYHEPLFNQRYDSYEKAIHGHQYAIDDIKTIIEEETKTI